MDKGTEHEAFCEQHRWSMWRWMPFFGIGDAYRVHEECAREYLRWRHVLDTCARRLDEHAISEELVARAVSEYEVFDRHADTLFVHATSIAS